VQQQRVHRSIVSTDLDDWPLVADGDHEAFARVFDRHADLVFRYVRRRTGSDTLAEDVTAQVFLETWRQRRDVSLLDGTLRAWLLGVARNLERRHWRTQERQRHAVARLDQAEVVTDPIDDVAGQFDARTELETVRTRLTQLSDSHREVLLLSVWENLTYAEIAVVLDTPIGTVRSRLARARQQLSLPNESARQVAAPPDATSVGDSHPKHDRSQTARTTK
jgi:RNA polymerase sigma factor (sigma-70 family)